jgi:hypothetical protein
LSKARTEIARAIREFGMVLTTDYSIKEIQLEFSFSAEGKFLGFGAGGAASFKVVVVPKG